MGARRVVTGFVSKRGAYLAISMAPALQGVVQIMDGMVGLPGWIEVAPWLRREGERIGEEKERR